ncbi:MAG: hypothetical protein FJW56_06910 [Actinobacteria bacterium]|nr:hypothetical protein [Actinomycetota bacterium]
MSNLPENVKELMNLHIDFWNHKLKKPIINHYSLWKRINNLMNLPDTVLNPDWIKLGEGAEITVDMLKPQVHHYYYEFNEFGDSRMCPHVFNTIIPWTMVTWLPAIAGCRLKISVKGQTIWPEEYIKNDWYQKENLGLIPNWHWLDKLKEFTSFLVDRYSVSRVISLEMFSRGPGDMLVNCLGTERTYFAMHDRPQELKKLLLMLADIHIKWSYEQLKIIPSLYNGYCNQWGIWAPGKVTRIQEDYAVNLAEKHFREFLEPADLKIIEASPYQVFHTHSGFPDLSEWVLHLEGLKVVEVTMDPISPSLEELLPIWKEILTRKSLIITGTFTESQVKMMISKLDNSGLFLDVDIET